MKTALLLLLLLLAAAQGVADAGELTPFRSDGCSRFPDGTPTHPQLWLDCCVAHDLAYWQGGTRQQRLEADRQLRVCVSRRADAALGYLMFSGVRIGGSPRWSTDFRWGFGWSPARPYGALNDEERQQVKSRLAEWGKSDMPQAGAAPGQGADDKEP